MMTITTCPFCQRNIGFQISVYQGHLGITDPQGNSILNVIDQGGLQATLKLAHDVAMALNAKAFL